MSIKISQKTYSPLPDGIYPAEVTDIEETTGQFGEQLKFTFRLLSQPDRDIFYWCSKKFTGGTKPSKLYKVTRVLLGNPIPTNMMFDSDQLIGRKARLNIIKVDTEKGTSNRVEAVLPFAARPAQTAPHVAEEPPLPPEPPEEDGEDLWQA